MIGMQLALSLVYGPVMALVRATVERPKVRWVAPVSQWATRGQADLTSYEYGLHVPACLLGIGVSPLLVEGHEMTRKRRRANEPFRGPAGHETLYSVPMFPQLPQPRNLECMFRGPE